MPVFPRAHKVPLITVRKSSPSKDKDKTEHKKEIKKMAMKTNTSEEISSVMGLPLYLATKMPCGRIFRLRYCKEDRNMILNLKILMPPEVDPLHAPTDKDKVRKVIAKFPNCSKSVLTKPVEVMMEMKLKAAMRKLSAKDLSLIRQR